MGGVKSGIDHSLENCGGGGDWNSRGLCDDDNEDDMSCEMYQDHVENEWIDCLDGFMLWVTPLALSFGTSLYGG